MRGKISRFLNDNGGASALEFALIAVPFTLIIFVILNFSIIIIGKQLMSNYIDEEARHIKITTRNEINIDLNNIKTRICRNISNFIFADCDSMDIDLRGFDTVFDKKIGELPQGVFKIERIKHGQVVRLVFISHWHSVFGLFDNYFNPLQSFSNSYEIRTWVNE